VDEGSIRPTLRHEPPAALAWQKPFAIDLPKYSPPNVGSWISDVLTVGAFLLLGVLCAVATVGTRLWLHLRHGRGE